MIKKVDSSLLFTSTSSPHDIRACKLHERMSELRGYFEITEDPTFAGPPHPPSLLKVREQHRLFQISDPLHTGGTAASSRHVLQLHSQVVCSCLPKFNPSLPLKLRLDRAPPTLFVLRIFRSNRVSSFMIHY